MESNASHNYITEVESYLKRLFPLNRSLTGDDNRETLKILREILPIKIVEYPSGKKVFDWTIPQEWKIRDGWIKNEAGDKIVDFKKNNLHVAGYSRPVHKNMTLQELLPHLHYSEKLPSAIPYKTTYYADNWGFCLSYNEYKKHFQKDEKFEILIDSELTDGSLTTGEVLIPGKSKKEYLISTYTCHPSMANDNISGMLLTALLGRELLKKKRNYSYRILFVPETIGAITYCATHKNSLKMIQGALIASCVAGKGEFGYKQTFLGNHHIDKAIRLAFKEAGVSFVTYPFEPQGSDERQYSSPGFRIPCASIHKGKYHEYKEYHTSLDNLEFISAKGLLETLQVYEKTLNILDNNSFLTSLNPHCEPNLGKRGLYPTSGVTKSNVLPNHNKYDPLRTIACTLFSADGKTTLIDIADRFDIPFSELHATVQTLEKHALIKRKIAA